MPTTTQEPAATPHVRLNAAILLLRIASRRRRFVFLIAAATLVLLLVVTALLPSYYTASVVLLPPQPGASVGSELLAQLGNIGASAMLAGGMGIKNPNDLQVSLLKSRTVERAMVARFHLQAEYHKRYVSSACKRWEAMTSISNGLKDGLIRVSVSDRDPRRAAELASGWVEEYRHLTASLAISEASQRRLFFERELNGARDDLARAEDNLKNTQQRTGVLEINGQARALIASAAMLRAQVAAKQVEIRSMREFAASGNPDLARAEQELSSLESQLNAMDIDNDHGQGDLISPQGKITQDGLEYTRALREVKYREAMYELLARQYEVARLDEARQGAPIQIVDPPLVPDRPDSRYRLWGAIAAFILALPLGLCAAWVAEAVSVARRLHLRHGSWTAVIEEAWNGVEG